MAQLIGQGGTITLDAQYADLNGSAKDPTSPQVSIVDPNGATIIDLDTPTRVGLGHYQYLYAVAGDALEGAWEVRWYGLINGVQVGPVAEGFTVAAGGAIVPGTPSPNQTCSAWATHEDAPADCANYEIDTDELDTWMGIATDILWNLTRRRWSGICSDAVRPQAQWKKWDGPPAWWPSLLAQGAQAPWGFCTCHRGRETGCARVPELRLPRGPVIPETISVMLDGAPFTEFRLDDSRWLVRTDGHGWPCCQNLLADDSEPNTFSVAYQFGSRPPAAGVKMAALYGCQLTLAAAGSSACKLPARVVRVSRQGTTSSMTEPATLIEKGQVGLPIVDTWIAAVNKGNASRRATLIVPGRGRPHRRTNH